MSTYVNKVRVEQAKGMLRYSRLPVADVACACGFNDPNYFSRVFARIMASRPRSTAAAFWTSRPASRRRRRGEELRGRYKNRPPRRADRTPAMCYP